MTKQFYYFIQKFSLIILVFALGLTACEKDEIFDLNSQLQAEVMERERADARLAQGINEVEARLSSFQDAQAVLDAGQDAVIAANDVASIARDAQEEAARAAGDDALNAELISTREELSTAIATLADELYDQVARIDSTALANFTVLTEAIVAEAAARTEGDDALAAALKLETEARIVQAQTLLAGIQDNYALIQEVAADLEAEVIARGEAIENLGVDLLLAIEAGDAENALAIQGAIDTQIADNAAAILRLDALDTQASLLQGSLTEAQNAIEALEDVDHVANGLILLSAAALAADDAIEAARAALQLNIDAAQDAAEAAQMAADAAQGLADANQIAIQSLTTSLTTLADDVKAIDFIDASELAIAIENFATDAEVAAAISAASSDTLSKLDDVIGEVNAAIISGDAATLAAAVIKISEAVADLGDAAAIVELQSQIAELIKIAEDGGLDLTFEFDITLGSNDNLDAKFSIGENVGYDSASLEGVSAAVSGTIGSSVDVYVFLKPADKKKWIDGTTSTQLLAEFDEDNAGIFSTTSISADEVSGFSISVIKATLVIVDDQAAVPFVIGGDFVEDIDCTPIVVTSTPDGFTPPFALQIADFIQTGTSTTTTTYNEGCDEVGSVTTNTVTRTIIVTSSVVTETDTEGTKWGDINGDEDYLDDIERIVTTYTSNGVSHIIKGDWVVVTDNSHEYVTLTFDGAGWDNTTLSGQETSYIVGDNYTFTLNPVNHYKLNSSLFELTGVGSNTVAILSAAANAIQFEITVAEEKAGIGLADGSVELSVNTQYLTDDTIVGGVATWTSSNTFTIAPAATYQFKSFDGLDKNNAAVIVTNPSNDIAATSVLTDGVLNFTISTELLGLNSVTIAANPSFFEEIPGANSDLTFTLGSSDEFLVLADEANQGNNESNYGVAEGGTLVIPTMVGNDETINFYIKPDLGYVWKDGVTFSSVQVALNGKNDDVAISSVGSSGAIQGTKNPLTFLATRTVATEGTEAITVNVDIDLFTALLTFDLELGLSSQQNAFNVATDADHIVPGADVTWTKGEDLVVTYSIKDTSDATFKTDINRFDINGYWNDTATTLGAPTTVVNSSDNKTITITYEGHNGSNSIPEFETYNLAADAGIIDVPEVVVAVPTFSFINDGKFTVGPQVITSEGGYSYTVTVSDNYKFNENHNNIHQVSPDTTNNVSGGDQTAVIVFPAETAVASYTITILDSGVSLIKAAASWTPPSGAAFQATPPAQLELGTAYSVNVSAIQGKEFLNNSTLDASISNMTVTDAGFTKAGGNTFGSFFYTFTPTSFNGDDVTIAFAGDVQDIDNGDIKDVSFTDKNNSNVTLPGLISDHDLSENLLFHITVKDGFVFSSGVDLQNGLTISLGTQHFDKIVEVNGNIASVTVQFAGVNIIGEGAFVNVVPQLEFTKVDPAIAIKAELNTFINSITFRRIGDEIGLHTTNATPSGTSIVGVGVLNASNNNDDDFVVAQSGNATIFKYNQGTDFTPNLDLVNSSDDFTLTMDFTKDGVTVNKVWTLKLGANIPVVGGVFTNDFLTFTKQ